MIHSLDKFCQGIRNRNGSSTSISFWKAILASDRTTASTLRNKNSWYSHSFNLVKIDKIVKIFYSFQGKIKNYFKNIFSKTKNIVALMVDFIVLLDIDLNGCTSSIIIIGLN